MKKSEVISSTGKDLWLVRVTVGTKLILQNNILWRLTLHLFFFQCLLLNISYCPSSEINLSEGKSLVSIKLLFPSVLFSSIIAICASFLTSFSSLQTVLAYNPLGWKRVDIVRLPVSQSSSCSLKITLCVKQLYDGSLIRLWTETLRCMTLRDTKLSLNSFHLRMNMRP